MIVWIFLLPLFLFFRNGLCVLWPKGIVHYAFNQEHYDENSQNIIKSTLSAIENDICVKFFKIPNVNESSNNVTRVLYINNPEKRQDCPPDRYDYTKRIVNMPIGYKCLNQKDIATVIVDMLISSIEDTVSTIITLKNRYQGQEDQLDTYLINRKARNFINEQYHGECNSLAQREVGKVGRRRSGSISLSRANEKYYKDKLWPLGILMYGIQKDWRNTPQHTQLKMSMSTIQLASCLIFQEVDDDPLKPKNMIWFGDSGNEMPNLGFKEGNQSVSITAMVEGARGYSSHTLNMLMRALGVPMVSNRPDRDNYINVHWNHVEKGKEFYLEKYPLEAWIRDPRLPYDFRSVTHAPTNYACGSACDKGETTVEPAHDNLWQRHLSMGHRIELSTGDRLMLNLLYNSQCKNRYANNK